MGTESKAAQTPDKGEPRKPTKQERPTQEQKDEGAHSQTRKPSR